MIEAASRATVIDVSKEKPKLDLVDLRDKNIVLRETLSVFLEENKLSLSKQNFDRAFQHLLACMADHKNLTSDDVKAYLNEVLEYHEYNIDVMNKTGLAEDSLIKILITADYDNIIRSEVKQWKLSWSSLPLPIAVSLALIIGAAIAQPALFPQTSPTTIQADQNSRVITKNQEKEIKELVQKIHLCAIHGSQSLFGKLTEYV